MKSKTRVLNRHVSVLLVLTMIVSMFSCSFLTSIKGDSEKENVISISSLSLNKTALSMKVGSMDYLSVTVKPQAEQKNIKLNWSYDKSILECDTSSNWGVTFKALKEGQTSLKCSYGGYDTSCIITVSGFEQGFENKTEPYIYSNTTILQTSPGISEKVFVSLYGGDASDIDGYTWTSEKTSVASIQPTGQYCIISAKEPGYSRIKITHTKAAYPYYIGVYVFEDATNVSYITTNNNILTMNKDDDEQTITVSLVNGKDSSLDSSFNWQLVNQDSNEAPVKISYNGNKAVVKPLQSGSCTLRITHPDAAYPLDILCRVITIVKNVYIQPDNTIVYLNGEAQQTVESSLENISNSEYSIDDYDYKLDNDNVATIISSVGNQVMLKGKANGSTKLLISHPKAAYPREVLLIVTGQLTDAIDASAYITTSQNYIRTKVGAEPTTLSVSLKGGVDGDEKGFIWNVKSTAKDGTSDVIHLETPHGSAVHSRAVDATYSYGNAYITPKAEGTAVITVKHPKVVYPTEILVKVLSKDAILEEQLYFTGSGLVKVLNGQSTEYTVQLRGKNKSNSDDAGITWSEDDSRFSVIGNKNTVTITAPAHGTGSTISHLTAKHKKADADKSVLVMTADDEETLKNMKALYSDKLYYNLNVGDDASVICNAVGFDDVENNISYDFSLFSWTVSDPSIISVEKNTSRPLICSIKGLKSGSAKLTGKITDGGTTYSCEFSITVYPKGASQLEPEVYFTTTQNVITLSGGGKTATVNVTAVNLPSNEYSNISWNCENSDVATVISNGISAEITAVGKGETVINVSHAESQNTLKIYVRVGSEYVIPETEPVVYISAQDVMTMLRDDSNQKLQAMLVNYTGAEKDGFNFTIDNEKVASIYAQTPNGIAYIKPVGSGQAEITISHPKSKLTKKVLVVVGNSAEELAGFTYLTTNSNVVAIGEGQTKSVSVSVKNAESVIVDGFTWSSSNPNVVSITDSGATAVLKGNSIGTAVITVKNKACKYSLQIIAQVVDPIAASANPYIQLTSSVMTLTVGTTYTSISAELVGGTESDKSNFTWSTNDSKIASVFGQNEVGKIRAMSAGTTYITVSHPKAAYPAQLLVVCDDAVKGDCYISVPSSIINMKPTDASQTISASLINGSTTDKYNFSWSLDVYDIIDFQYSANVCTITPKQTGSVTITISHPKAAYDQQVIVNVQQYSTFAFPNDNITITQGDVKFVSMQIPTTNVTTHVEYSVENSKICSITGTKTTAQLTAVGSGTTTVKARLIVSSTGAEQASSEMLVYVKEKETNAVYITSASTITTVNKGKSQTLSATLTGTGVVSNDQYNLKWTTSDSDIVQVTGIGSDGYVSGQSIYITALKSGEAVITCTHSKAASALQFYVVVPGSAEKVISFNKNFITLMKGSSGTPLKASIENAESSADYHKIIWSCVSSGNANEEVCRIMGSGQNVTIYPVKVGQATVMAQLPDASSVAKCTVVVEAGKSLVFESNTRRVQPKHSVTVKYKVSPPDAVLSWSMAQTEDFFEYHDNGCDDKGNGSVEIIGNSNNKAGSGTLACVTDGGAKGTIAVRVAWDYDFKIKGTTRFSITPAETKEVEYSVNPIDADIDINSTGLESKIFTYEKKDNGDGTGIITIKPLKENDKPLDINIVATNPKDDNKEVGSKQIKATFVYPNLSLHSSFVKSDGNFSNFNSSSDTLTIGDGENVQLKFKIKEKNTESFIKSATFTKSNGSTVELSCAIVKEEKDENFAIYSFSHPEDRTTMQYRIERAYVPTYNSKDILDWQTSLVWREETDGVGSANNDYFGLVHRQYSKLDIDANMEYQNVTTWDSYGKPHTSQQLVWNTGTDNSTFCAAAVDWISMYEDTTWSWTYSPKFSKREDIFLRGKTYSEDEFRKIAWFYCPGTIASGHTCHFIYYPVSNPGPHGEGAQLDFKERVMTENVTAVYETSTNKTVLSNTQIGFIKVLVSHLGKDKSFTIPVYCEERNCAKTCR